MKRLSDSHIGLMRLVSRSPDRGEGWRSVNSKLQQYVTDKAAEQPELYEIKREGESMFVRLSERGSILGDYI